MSTKKDLWGFNKNVAYETPVSKPSPYVGLYAVTSEVSKSVEVLEPAQINPLTNIESNGVDSYNPKSLINYEGKGLVKIENVDGTYTLIVDRLIVREFFASKDGTFQNDSGSNGNFIFSSASSGKTVGFKKMTTDLT